ncbi:MAG: Sensory transduction histidine kinase [Cyanobacteria bacterium RYN_339]|nr:Sensory transduction histidine kinase [Cyanobacteria bacterium RYN_339]
MLNGDLTGQLDALAGRVDALLATVGRPGWAADRAQQELADVAGALRTLQARSWAPEAAKTQFLANMSHEIRTPLGALLGFADLLTDQRLGESDRLNYALIMRRNGEHLLSMINNVLDLSKIEAGQLTVERTACSVVQLLQDVDSLMRARATGKGLDFEVVLLTPLPERITGDPMRIRQILINLVGNAVKFTPHGKVELRVAYEPGQLRFDVVDTGIGLSPEQLGQLFRPFEQADPSMTRRFGGTGLGLAICRPLAVALGGDLAVVSEPGRGSTFSFSMAAPDAEGQVVDLAVASAAGDVPAPSRDLAGRVLLVEDGLDNQLLVATMLRKRGLVVVVAENGQVGLERALAAATAGEAFDLVLMDMQMPVLDGYAATMQLRERGYRGAIVAFTAHAMPGERERCLAAGCDDYLSKPVDRNVLMQLVSRYVAPISAVPEPPAAATPADGDGPQTVLVVDDSEDIHLLVKARLKPEGLRLLHAHDPEAAIALAQQHLPDLVLLDLDLGGQSGIEVCRRFKDDLALAGIPIIFLTGTVDVEVKVQAFDAGAVDYVTKPFDAVELRARVRAALRAKRFQDLLATRARVDGLTGLFNRAFFDDTLAKDLLLAQRHDRPLSLVMVDVDHFKKLNDTYGHPFGDAVLQRVAKTLMATIRQTELPCRYGGEEFAVVLRETDLAGAMRTAERLRVAIEGIELSHGGNPVRITASLGVSCVDALADPRNGTPMDLLADADAGLYAAKQGGRNRSSYGQLAGRLQPRTEA